MPIVAGNGSQSTKESKGSNAGCGWVIFLLIFLWRPLSNIVRNAVNGRISDQQLLMIAGGVVALIVLAAIVQRVNRGRESGMSRLPTSYTPSSTLASSYQQLKSSGEPYVPPTPRFEPIITGKVVLAGVFLLGLFGGIGVLLMWLG